MRVGLEHSRFVSCKRGCVWTNLPEYGKILTLKQLYLVNKLGMGDVLTDLQPAYLAFSFPY